MEWSTKQCPTDQALGSWADDLANAFVQLEPRKITEHPFQGTISRIDAAPIRISRVIATKHRVLRLRSHIAHSTDDLCFINLQLEGVGRYAQRGQSRSAGLEISPSPIQPSRSKSPRVTIFSCFVLRFQDTCCRAIFPSGRG
jgi:AraC family transcriptional activator of tynA and feaB